MAAYRVKWIRFFQREVSILCQNENGPCPLIALANILSLQGFISIHPDYASIELSDVIQLVADRLLTSYENFDDAQRRQQIFEVIDILPKLQYGLDINLKFDRVDSFEFTQELSVFDAFDITLVHGWLPDVEDKIKHDLISKMSYNQLCFKAIESNSANEQRDPNFQSIESKNQASNYIDSRTEGQILNSFLLETASQLTYAGLVALHQALRERQLVVLFRNNHFSSVIRYQDKLYQLVTDLGYADELSVVWEGLDVIDGDTEYFDSSFTPIASTVQAGTLGVAAKQADLDSDYLLALQLQDQPPSRNASLMSVVSPSVLPVHAATSPSGDGVGGSSRTGTGTGRSVGGSRPTSSLVNTGMGVGVGVDASEQRRRQEERDHLAAMELQAMLDEGRAPSQPSLSAEELELQRQEHLRYERMHKSAEKHPAERTNGSSCALM